LKSIDINALSPMEAFDLLKDLSTKLSSE